MCGIAGEIFFSNHIPSPRAIASMMDAMAPRGPDAAGVHMGERFAFGHRRLKIIDLSARGAQPMVDAALGLTLVFNGCIYNYRALREELGQQGYRFFSDSDTEVILKAYHAWGADCVARFNGMFAFAIHERDSGRVVLARDRLGIKPLYLAHDESLGVLRFASTLPALLAAGEVDSSIDPVALHHYLTFHSVVPAPFTIVRGVRKLPPGSLSVFEADGSRRDHVYWTPRFARAPGDEALSADEWAEMVHQSLRQAVTRRMVADVPVGVLLSGGVDSSLVVGLLAEAGQKGLKTFSIGFESHGGEAGDEFVYSDIVAKEFATDHHQIRISSDRLLAELPNAIAAMAEPMVSHDAIGFYLLSQEVARHVKVVQSGQGADEVFGGYHWYPPMAGSNDPVADYARVFFDRDHDDYMELIAPPYRTEDYSRAFVAGHFAMPGAETPVDQALRLDTMVMLVDDPVKRVDNMTMAWGLEARVPFLDHTLVECAARIPPELKLKDGGKGILKDVARKVVPAAVIDRPKGYFPVPALKYLSGPTLAMVKDAVTGRAAQERGLFTPAAVRALLEAPEQHITPLGGSKLWQLGLLELWLQAQGL
ncbi:MAG: N-acetylglutaminylglutamine amidotransferase [Pseudomonadota bacterium]